MSDVTGPILGTAIGGIISAITAYFTIRASSANQLKLEEQRFGYQKELEADKREHDASAFRRIILRAMRRLHNTARLEKGRRVSVHAWKEATAALRGLLESADCPRALNNKQYELMWRVCEESEAAIMFLEIWHRHHNTPDPEVVLLSLREYANALEAVFSAFGETVRAADVNRVCADDFKGASFWMSGDFQENAVAPNP